MFTMPVTKEEILADLPQIQEWLNLAENFFKKEIDDSKLEFYYTYGFFLPKAKDKEKQFMELFEKTSTMLFDERLEYEYSKVRTSVSMKLGQLFISDRLEKKIVPDTIKNIVREITKVRMLVEYEQHQNDDVKDSIPDVDTSIVSFDIIKDTIGEEYKANFDIDAILDKINKNGFDSLSQDEKDYLDRKSKEME